MYHDITGPDSEFTPIVFREKGELKPGCEQLVAAAEHLEAGLADETNPENPSPSVRFWLYHICQELRGLRPDVDDISQKTGYAPMIDHTVMPEGLDQASQMVLQLTGQRCRVTQVIQKGNSPVYYPVDNERMRS